MSSRVRTRHGEVEGRQQGSVHGFLGLPFAQPPVGALRWRPPVPPVPWDGVRMATGFGPASPQIIPPMFKLRTTKQSEDCHYLNVWTSELGHEARQPVMVWIHGGGYLGGAGSEAGYDGARLAAHGVTAVTVNYRLGAFGLAAHPAIGANFAILDHITALTWVAENIAPFGGDPANVTVFGQSAGAVWVRSLLAAPKAHGLGMPERAEPSHRGEHRLDEYRCREHARGAPCRSATAAIGSPPPDCMIVRGNLGCNAGGLDRVRPDRRSRDCNMAPLQPGNTRTHHDRRRCHSSRPDTGAPRGAHRRTALSTPNQSPHADTLTGQPGPPRSQWAAGPSWPRKSWPDGRSPSASSRPC